MELVVGASEETMRSLLGKLGGLLSQEYTLIRGVDGDLQYINDELATMQSFLRCVGSRGSNDVLTKDWMKQIRDLTYDIEDCIDDSGNRLHGLPTGMPCYFLLNSVFEVLTWWPRRDIAARISTLKMRAQQIGERRERYGVNNPQTGEPPAGPRPPTKAAAFVAADNQDGRLQLVDRKDPVGVEQHMKGLSKRVTCLVGFGGVGKTAVATALYRNLKEKFVHSAVVTVSQSSDVEAILRSIISQIKPKASNHQQQQQGGSAESVIKGARDHLSRGKSAVMSKCCGAATLEQEHDGTKIQLKKELEELIQKNSYLVLIDDVWSAIMLENIINALPYNNNDEDSRIIVTTRFLSVATTRREADVRRVTGLHEEESKKLFEQAFSESKGSKDGTIIWQEYAAPSNREVSAQDVPKETGGRVQPQPGPHHNIQARKDATVPNEVWKMCGGLPLAIVTMAGYVACNPDKDWSDVVCSSPFSELGQGHRKELTQDEVGKIISYCYDDMPAEIKTCSMYLSIFPKGHRISRKRLTRRWIAEGFVREKHGLSVEEVAETYFNHLIRRKIIRPVEHSSNGKVKKCIVHDMVLEHIVAKASEENFITVVGGNWLMQPPSSKVRRLSLQACDSNRAKDTEKMNMSHVRSVTMFGSLNNQLHAHLFKLGIVQIMDLEGCKGFKQHHIIEICRMVLLKYLSLRRTDTKCLPNKIKKLKNLETLDIRETDIIELPYSICQLERLVNLLGGNKTTRKALKLPQDVNRKKKMKALRILSGIEIDEASVDLHHLTELRKLAIYKLNTKGGAASFKELISSIEYLGGYSLHTLVIDDESSEFIKSLDDLSSPPKFLIALELSGKMAKLPNCLKHLHTLSKLTLSVTALRTDNLKDLSNLEALFSLTFSFRAKRQDRQTLAIVAENKMYSKGKVTVPADGFKSLKLMRLSVSGLVLPLLSFSNKAMPELERLELRYNMLEGLSGVENLVKLKEVHFTSDAKADEGTMTKAIVAEMKNALNINGKTAKIIVHN